MMSWFVEAATSPVTNKLSSSRVIALVAGLSLSFVVVLAATLVAYAVTFDVKVEVISQLTSVIMTLGPTLGMMAGASYVTNKMASGKKDDAA